DSPDLETLPKAFHLPTLEDFFASIATGDIRIKQAMNRLLPEPISPAEKPVESSEAPVISRRTNDDLVIDGVDNLLFKMAGCCRPVVGDAVMGYITQGKGVSIHRQDCQNFARLETLNADRSVRVTWSQHVRSHYPVTLTVRGEDRPGLLKDITSSLVSLEVSLLRMQSSVSRREGQMTQMTLQVRNTEELAKIMNVLKQVKGVSSVVRS
ncbi:MAG: bifunctional (p)ppGpp synthetase/guanosine-3',5'-bis(diphosphate) 3'-pyrophosphohydrolase, partial [Gammaproteobacteria bacterium]|nr:bifunctional (p)ppGpp synthetase/guanosine-3',5'-bis(diphosphate) 3'-pyrophosphohydrolase [Gammaproteobacteria bacterium]